MSLAAPLTLPTTDTWSWLRTPAFSSTWTGSAAASSEALKFPDVLQATLAYLDARLKVLEVSKELSAVYSRMIEELDPQVRKLNEKMDRAIKALEDYKESAKAYRDSMR